MSGLFVRTNPMNRRLAVAVLVGIAGGILSAMVKSGFEDIVPPRLPDAVPPPIELLQMMGLDAAKMTYTWLKQAVNYGGNGVHYLFSVVFAVLYCAAAEVFPKVKMAWGLVYGYAVAFGSHYVVFPLIGLPVDFTVEGFVSECIGTALWMLCIEIVRRDLRNRWTGLPDA
ncbi:DUF1440 domain-containing protein [Bergeriella denitrificans]|uniref:Inner membrane protein yagU n=1 Tax=Bergeriella denitrificans TaxID=494 RepID=A0A378UDJ4_BERDE|nr:DUF1440 domain-containing protein [Bergeriella denitrificans]STZ75474.1 Inner membrane protein yagU [Bergeriella denitrificans]